MATIVQAVHGFLREIEWNWQEVDEHRLRVPITGENGRWVWLAGWREELAALQRRSRVDPPGELYRRCPVRRSDIYSSLGFTLLLIWAS